MADLGVQERTIQGEARECRSLLADTMAHLTRHGPLSIRIELQDELGRFNLWAENIGVFAPLQASLDFRLIDVPDVRAQFLRQLDTLSVTLTQRAQIHFKPQEQRADKDVTVNEAAVQASTEANEDPYDEDATREPDGPLLSGHDIVDLVDSIHVTIDWLHRLSNIVRKASFGSLNQRAANFPLEDEAGNDITECLAAIFKYLIKRECYDVSDQILNRLVQTMIIRRRRVLYRRSRQKRWVSQQEEYQPRRLAPPAQLAALQEEDESGEGQSSREVTEEVKFETESRAEVAPSWLTITTLDQQEYGKLAAPSRISLATSDSLQHDEKLLIPPRPHLTNDGKEFVCDYCCLILPSSEAADQETWANHVKKDLDPYICVFDDCSLPYRIFSSIKEWLAHMRSEHRMSWRCVVRDHPPQTFESREAFFNHIKDAHPGKFRKEQLPSIAESSARALRPTVSECPFCAENSGDLENHVAQHLFYFALQSIPWPDHLLDVPVPWPNVERIFSEPDKVLSESAAQATRYAAMTSKKDHGEPVTLDEELRQVREELPSVVWKDIDLNTRLLRASLRRPWGFVGVGEHLVLNVKIAVPDAYPEAQAPSFLIEDDERVPRAIREILQQKVQEIGQHYLQRQETCLVMAFSYLLGVRDFTSSINMFNAERGNATPLGDVDEDKPPASPVLQPDGIDFAKVDDRYESTTTGKTAARPISGYLTKRENDSGSWESRFYVIEGPQLKYYDAVGGAQLGSIKLHGAQIGKQQTQSDTSSAVDTQFSHAILILELEKDASTIRHVLCAESDEECDLWVEALLPWTNQEASDHVKTDSSTGRMWPTKKPIRSTYTNKGYSDTDSATGSMWSTKGTARSIDTNTSYSETDSSTGSMWSTQQPIQSKDTKVKINNKGQFVTVINQGQQKHQDTPSPTYRSAKTYGKQG